MLLLWLNALAAAAATTVWVLWAIVWVRRRCVWYSVLYGLAAVGSICVGIGMLVVIAGGDPGISAVVSRRWLPLALGAPALARLLELTREMRRRTYADALMDRAERRADEQDASDAADQSGG